MILTALTRLVTEEKDNPKLRGSCYVAVGRIYYWCRCYVAVEDLLVILVFCCLITGVGVDVVL